MKIIRDIRDMQAASRDARTARKRVGFVPTMGALHEGHLSLLRIARQHCDLSVMSIFVNPTQFGPSEDFAQYPRPFEKDCKKAADEGCDILFAPEATDVYPAEYLTTVTVETITETLEGASRPGHFTGVTTIVLKLFNMVMPDVAVFGQKDAQQALVIRRMVTDLNCGPALIIAPTIREEDGLAISSRNVYLTKEERTDVPLIFRGLSAAGEAFAGGERSVESLTECIEEVYARTTLFQTEYIAFADTETLAPVPVVAGKTLVAVACRTAQTSTRLIDNCVLGGTL